MPEAAQPFLPTRVLGAIASLDAAASCVVRSRESQPRQRWPAIRWQSGQAVLAGHTLAVHEPLEGAVSPLRHVEQLPYPELQILGDCDDRQGMTQRSSDTRRR